MSSTQRRTGQYPGTRRETGRASGSYSNLMGTHFGLVDSTPTRTNLFLRLLPAKQSKANSRRGLVRLGGGGWLIWRGRSISGRSGPGNQSIHPSRRRPTELVEPRLADTVVFSEVQTAAHSVYLITPLRLTGYEPTTSVPPTRSNPTQLFPSPRYPHAHLPVCLVSHRIGGVHRSSLLDDHRLPGGLLLPLLGKLFLKDIHHE